MAGIFGLISTNPPVDIQGFLDSAGKAMCHRPWYALHTWSSAERPVGVGQIGIGIFNREPPPVSTSDGLVTLWLCGEFYKTETLQQQLVSVPTGHRPADPDLALAAYLEDGPGFASRLNGAFFVVVYDRRNGTLVLTNDRFGLYPHYYAVTSGQLVYAPEVKGILCAPSVPRKPDLTAACEYFRFQQVLGEKTFHQGISLFPYGSLAIYDIQSGDWTVRRYWDWDQIPDRPAVRFEEAVEEAGYLLKEAVVRLSQDVRPGVFLTGGLDSRTILGMLPTQVARQTVTATFGQRTSRDVVYAGQIARAAGSQHHWFDLPDGRWVLEHAEDHFQLVEGFHSWVHMHGISMLRDLRSQMDCNLSGWDGGTIMGHLDHINPRYNHPVDQSALTLHAYSDFISSFTWPGITDAEEHLLFTPEFQPNAAWRAYDSFAAEINRFFSFRKEYAGEYFYLVNHCLRSTQPMITITRSSMESRFPYWDYDLIDFIYSLRPEVRGNRTLQRGVMTRFTPRMARIPYEQSEFLPTLQPAVYSVQKIGMKILKKLRIIPDRPRLYADYENYLRSDLREWAEELLFSPRTIQRGIFNPSFVRSLFNRHLAGNEPWTLGKIAPLMSYEMVMRHLFD